MISRGGIDEIFRIADDIDQQRTADLGFELALVRHIGVGFDHQRLCRPRGQRDFANGETDKEQRVRNRLPRTVKVSKRGVGGGTLYGG